MSNVRFHFVHQDPDGTPNEYSDDVSLEIATMILQQPGGGKLKVKGFEGKYEIRWGNQATSWKTKLCAPATTGIYQVNISFGLKNGNTRDVRVLVDEAAAWTEAWNKAKNGELLFHGRGGTPGVAAPDAKATHAAPGSASVPAKPTTSPAAAAASGPRPATHGMSQAMPPEQKLSSESGFNATALATSGKIQSEVAQTLSVTLRTLSGDLIQLPPADLASSVRDLATLVRAKTGIPISAQNLIWGTELLTDPSIRLQKLFGAIEAVELTVVRRPFTAPERAQMYSRLVRAVVGGAVPEFRELLKEGAQPNFKCEATGLETSACLSHWEDLPESAIVVDGREESQEHGEKPSQEPVVDHSQDSSDDEGDDEDSPDDSPSGDGYAVSIKGTCGGLTPLMMAVAVGDEDFARDLRELGAEEAAMIPQHPTIGKAFQVQDFADVVKHIAAGADLNTRLRRGQGIQDTNEGVPLHACAALHSSPGAYEVAQLLIRKRADLAAGDTEGDTPLAHARYFRATEMYRLLQGHGAELRGPYYRRFGLR